MLPVEHTYRLDGILLFPKGLIVDARLLKQQLLLHNLEKFKEILLTSEPTKRLIA